MPTANPTLKTSSEAYRALLDSASFPRLCPDAATALRATYTAWALDPFDKTQGELAEAVRQSDLAAQSAYELFGVKDHLGVNYGKHGHAFTTEDWTAIMDFFDKNLLGKKIDRTFDRFPTEKELDDAAAAAKGRAGAAPKK